MSRLFPAYFRAPLFKEPLFDDPNFFEGIEYPNTDIKESDDSYTVIADLPGMPKENIEVTYQDNVLTIEAKHEVSTEEKDDERKYIRRERSSKHYKRQYVLNNVKKDAVSAAYDNGVLTITLEKETKEALPTVHKIEIK